MPGARCTRGLVCKLRKENAHEHTGTAGTLRHSLRKGASGGKKAQINQHVRLLCSHLCPDPLLIGLPERNIDAYRALWRA